MGESTPGAVPDGGADMFDLIPDVTPTDQPTVSEIEDACGSVARKFAFIGIGQAGCTLCDAFYSLGYRRVLAVSTTPADCANLKLPPENQLLIGSAGGSDKDRAMGAAAMRSAREVVYEAAVRMLGTGFDRCMVLASAGGGTGSGGFVEAAGIADDLMQNLRLRRPQEPTKVGVMLVLPSCSDGAVYAVNAVAALKDAESLLNNKRVSPLVLVDNERLGKMFQTGMLTKLPTYNAYAVGLFNALNVLASATSRYSQVFDPAEYDSLLDSGVLSFGRIGLKVSGGVLNHQDAIASMGNIAASLIVSDLDCARATVAAGVINGAPADLDNLGTAEFEAIGSALQRSVKGARSVHMGMYNASKTPSILVAVGGAPLPADRIREMAAKG